MTCGLGGMLGPLDLTCGLGGRLGPLEVTCGLGGKLGGLESTSSFVVTSERGKGARGLGLGLESVITYHNIARYILCILYSGTSHNGHSEKRTTSVQRTNSMTRIEFSIALILNEPPRSGQPLYSVQRTITMPPTDKM